MNYCMNELLNIMKDNCIWFLLSEQKLSPNSLLVGCNSIDVPVFGCAGSLQPICPPAPFSPSHATKINSG